jgi:hypothetical protein
MNHQIMLSNSFDFNLPQLFQLAEALMNAPGFVPAHIKHPGSIVAAILTGRELGIPPMAALRGISFVDGKPVLDQSLHLGCMIARGVKYRWISDGSDGTAQLWLQRHGQEPFVSVFSLEMAKKAGLLNKSNWQKYQAAMLRARAVSAASRAYMPDVLSGCFVPGELEADRDERPPNESMEPATLPAQTQHNGQGQGAIVMSALPAETEHAAPLDLPARIVRDLYAITSQAMLDKLNTEALAAWSGLKRDEKLAIKNAREWATKRLGELAQEDAAFKREAEEAEAALASKVDAALEGQGALEPGASDAPDVADVQQAAGVRSE